MRRPRLLAIAFGISLVLGLAGMAWVSFVALDLEQASLRQNAQEENVRIALWRMHGVIAPLISQESSRPYFHYRAYYPVQRAYTRMLEPVENTELLVASPLLRARVPLVRLHFQVNADGVFESPQVTATQTEETESWHSDEPERKLAQLRQHVSASQLRSAVEPAAQAPALAAAPPQKPQSKAIVQQRERSRLEQQQLSNQIAQAPAGPSDVTIGPMSAAWVGGELLLLRAVALREEHLIQGCWLDRPALEQRLLGQIIDLFPDARLEPVRGPASDPSRLLGLLPFQLVEGETALELAPAVSPVRRSLWVAWSAFALSLAAVIGLMFGALALSEKRAAFVSAVTHELRTPLTTFRLYTDLLAQSHAVAPEKRAHYVGTLQTEAMRLSGLIENVLAYARLERGVSGRVEAVHGGDLLARTLPPLELRAAQAGVVLDVDANTAARDAVLRVDPGAVERILFNLVDNACRHGGGAAIEMTCTCADGSWIARVVDHGAGIDRAAARRLFQAFRRAAGAAGGGIGLGLALSRRLARRMGGDLALERSKGQGACFRLTLPASLAPPEGHR